MAQRDARWEIRVLVRAVLCILWLSCCGARAWSVGCVELEKFVLRGGVVNRAELVRAGPYSVAGRKMTGDLPEFCRVVLTLTPSSDSEIHVEAWMPVEGWNGRMEGTGNGGFAGGIDYDALSGGVRLGYAVVNTDMGMATPPNESASAFVGRPERWKDWGYRATHEMTVAGKQIVRAFYGRGAERAYFAGCSTGGEQALMEAQRFPEDYDGIVAGAPANNRTGVHTSILWDFAATRREPSVGLSEGQLQTLSRAVLRTCDRLDGVADGIIDDPRACRFDPAELRCTGKNASDCLSSEQVEAVRKIYAGPTDSVTGKSLYAGVPRGSETGWSGFGPPVTEKQVPPFAPIFEWVFGRDWDWRTFNFGSDFREMSARLGATLNASDPDLSRFRRLGHKLIVYHGWADWLVPPEESIAYFDAVQRLEARGKKHEGTGEFYRLFMVPGMQHCGGGAGADRFDALGAAVDWVERGKRPDRLIASGVRSGSGKEAGKDAGEFERVLCPYPERAIYSGNGNGRRDVDRATSFRCRVGK